MPVALALASGGAAAQEAADVAADDPEYQLTEVVIVGGGSFGEWQSVFLESELESEDEWLDAETPT